MIVSGSAVVKSPDPKKTINDIRDEVSKEFNRCYSRYVGLID